MDKYMNEYKAVFDSITAEKDIVAAAKSRITKGSRTHFVRQIAAAACAVMLVGTTAVYAAHSDWLHSLFGNTSSEISENISDYTVKTSDFTLDIIDDSFPYEITFGNVICDGTILYGEMHINDVSGEAIRENDLPIDANVTINGDNTARRQSGLIFLNENDDGSADAAFYISSESEISAGDSVTAVITGNAVSPDDKTAFSFEILNMPRTLAKHYDVDSTARFTTYKGENAEMQINSVEISPLRISVKGHCLSYDSYNKITESPDFRIDFSDGSCMTVDNRSWVLNTENSGGRSILNVGGRVCETSGFSGTRTSTGYDVDYTAQFRCVIPIDEVVSVTVGDITIPVQ
ncbi:MAG: hypothetical protein MSH60_01545 [Ruminococcus sp.]|nr:hypothetical protein [Ruminococcus sp.]